MADIKKAALALLAAAPVSAAAADLPAGVIAVPLIRNSDQTAYYAKFGVGTPPQTEYLKIDTGSPRYSFMDPRNAVCQSATQQCKMYGTFDNLTSSTSEYAGMSFQDALQAYGYGDYLNDTLQFSGVTVERMHFGYTSGYNAPSRAVGNMSTILGLSLDCQFAGPDCTWQGAYFLPQLKNASRIDAMATSIYLGPNDQNVTNAQMLMGGYYDKAKVDGEMFTVNMVDPHDLLLSNAQTNVVNVTAMEFVVDSTNKTRETYGPKNVGTPVLLDTGVASFYMTQTIFDQAYYALGGRGAVTPGNQYKTVDCAYRDPKSSQSYISVEFGSAGSIKVPLYALVTKLADGTCGAPMEARGDTATTLGDGFLRSAYIIYNQEDFTVTLGQVKHTNEEDIVPFPTGGFKSSA